MAFEHIAHPRKRAMLSAYSVTGMVTQAAQKAGVSRESHYSWLAADPEYAEAFAAASVMAGDWIEEQAIGRGVLKSDKLLLEVLRALKPEKYGRRQVDHRHSGAVLHKHVDLSSLDDAELESLERILGKARVGGDSGGDSGGTGAQSGSAAGSSVPGDGSAGQGELPETP